MTRKTVVISVVLAFLVSIVLSYAWDAYFDEESSSPPLVKVSATVQEKAAPVIMKEDYASTMKVRFKRNKINDSMNRILPVPMYRAVQKFVHDESVSATKRAERAQKVWRWLGTPMGKRHVEAAACAFPDTIMLSPCIHRFVVNGDNVLPIEHKITKVKVVCGGSAVVGTVKGGIVGAGLGVSLCLYNEVAKNFFD